MIPTWISRFFLKSKPKEDWFLDFERGQIAKAKARGANRYVFVSLSDIPGEGETAGENLAHFVLDKWPGAIADPDKRNARRWGFLLPN